MTTLVVTLALLAHIPSFIALYYINIKRNLRVASAWLGVAFAILGLTWVLISVFGGVNE